MQFDSIVQTATGVNVAEGEAYATYEGRSASEGPVLPRALPMQALDHAAGYLLAFGINAALCKTVTVCQLHAEFIRIIELIYVSCLMKQEGGSWEVRVSLAAVGKWIRSLGRLEPSIGFGEGKSLPAKVIPQDPEIAALSVSLVQSSEDKMTSNKKMTAISHAALFSETPVREEEAPMRLNAHSATWLPRI